MRQIRFYKMGKIKTYLLRRQRRARFESLDLLLKLVSLLICLLELL